MAYSEFTLRDVERRLGLTVDDSHNLFVDVPTLQPSGLLQTILAKYAPVAVATGTEKARSEMMIAPVLWDVLEIMERRVSLFSGIDFSVDPARGLAGTCDYIIARSPVQSVLHAPAVIVVEAKRDNIQPGLGQCGATMAAARLFNQQDGMEDTPIYGAVTTGSVWHFLTLEAQTLFVDTAEYFIDQIGKILGILTMAARGHQAPVVV